MDEGRSELTQSAPTVADLRAAIWLLTGGGVPLGAPDEAVRAGIDVMPPDIRMSWPDAAAVFARALDRDPDDAEAHLGLALVLTVTGESDPTPHARAAGRSKALAWQAAAVEGRFAWGAGRADQASDLIERAIGLGAPFDVVEAWVDEFLTAGYGRLAADLVASAGRAGPSDPRVHALQAVLAYHAGDVGGMWRHYQSASRHAALSAGHIGRWAESLLSAGRSLEALTLLQTAARAHPEDAGIRYWTAVALIASGHAVRGRDLLESLIRQHSALKGGTEYLPWAHAQLLRANRGGHEVRAWPITRSDTVTGPGGDAR